jgi:hypothetical protein
MEKFKNYLDNNKIKENLTKEQLLELKELLAKEKDIFLFNRSKDCYL